MISVCIATYNGAKLIREQLESIIPQLGEGDEIVLSDDSSEDATLEIVRALNCPLVRVVQGPSVNSPQKNFEHALTVAKGDVIFLADQDDVWMPNKVEVMMRALTDADCVVSDCYVTDEALEVKADSFYALNRTQTGRLYNLLLKNGYLGCCMAFKREVAQKALPFPDCIPMHDIWLGNVAAFHFRLTFIPERLIYFRRHNHNASPTARSSCYSLTDKLMFRLHTAGQLMRLWTK